MTCDRCGFSKNGRCSRKKIKLTQKNKQKNIYCWGFFESEAANER